MPIHYLRVSLCRVVGSWAARYSARTREQKSHLRLTDTIRFQSQHASVVQPQIGVDIGIGELVGRVDDRLRNRRRESLG